MDASAAHGPRGIGLGVAFDWAVVVELAALATARLAGGPALGAASRHAGHSGAAVYVLALLLAAIPPLILGEALRQGRRWAWLLQIIANSLGAIGGLLTLPATFSSLRSGDAWPLIPTAILLVLSPFIVWRLTRPATRAWIARRDHAGARRRHGGLWLAQTWAGCAVGGIAVALSVLFG